MRMMPNEFPVIPTDKTVSGAPPALSGLLLLATLPVLLAWWAALAMHVAGQAIAGCLGLRAR